MDFFILLMKDVLGIPAVLVGLMALIGLLAQRKSFADTVSGTIKTIMGFLVLGGGATVLIGSLNHFGTLFEKGFGVQGIVPNNEAIVALAQSTFGAQTAMIMVFGMIVNILIARFTPWKYIFLTGHHIFYMACLFSAILAAAKVGTTAQVVLGSIMLGVVMVVSPAISQPFMRKVTGSDEIAMGHFGSIGYVASGLVGKWVGNSAKTTESFRISKNLMFLRDSSVAIALTMLVLFLVVSIATMVVAPDSLSKQSGGQDFIVFSILQAITFAGGVFIILAGVRLIISEIVPAFKGFADKIVPNAKPALDCPIVFPFAPTAVLVGFLASFLAGIIGMLGLIGLGASVIIPGVVPHFFTGAAAGVFGNATGGRRGAFWGAFTNGLLITFLPVWLLPVLGSLGFQSTTFGDADFGIYGILFGNLFRLFM